MANEPKNRYHTCNKPVDPSAFAMGSLNFDHAIDGIVNSSLREFSRHGQMTDMLRARELLAEMADLVKRKHRNYGEDNLTRFGIFGIIVRLADKFSRLQTLKASQDEVGEFVWDTWLDIMGYSVQAMRNYGHKQLRRQAMAARDENLLDAWNKLELIAVETFVAYGVFTRGQVISIRSFNDLVTHTLDAMILAEETEPEI